MSKWSYFHSVKPDKNNPEDEPEAAEQDDALQEAALPKAAEQDALQVAPAEEKDGKAEDEGKGRCRRFPY